MQYGLIGAKLAHSHSPFIHSLFASYSYQLFELSPSELPVFLKQENLGGCNVTIPYKKSVMDWCDTLSPEAQAIGSVNTLVFEKGGTISGYNTDYFGFLFLLKHANLSLNGKKVLILGSGGTSSMVQYAAKNCGAKEIVVISRSGKNNYENLSLHADADFLINTTPVGMYPNNTQSPLSLDAFPRLCAVVDVIYNPLQTKLLAQAKQKGISYANGLPMLVAQAAAACSLFTGTQISEEKIEEVLQTVQNKVTNLVLIGMPGCGKTSVGKKLSQKTGRPFFDIDEEIVLKAGKSIPEIFAEGGEASFRKIEAEVTAELSKKNGIILATGGGAPLFKQNQESLSQNGRIYLIDRPLSQLAVEGRPLSKDLPQMYKTRAPIYEAFCDYKIENIETIDAATDVILANFSSCEK